MLNDYDKLKDDYVWYLPCKSCGYETGKSYIPTKGNKLCWRCGDYIYRDYKKDKLNK